MREGGSGNHPGGEQPLPHAQIRGAPATRDDRGDYDAGPTDGEEGRQRPGGVALPPVGDRHQGGEHPGGGDAGQAPPLLAGRRRNRHQGRACDTQNKRHHGGETLAGDGTQGGDRGSGQEPPGTHRTQGAPPDHAPRHRGTEHALAGEQQGGHRKRRAGGAGTVVGGDRRSDRAGLSQNGRRRPPHGPARRRWPPQPRQCQRRGRPGDGPRVCHRGAWFELCPKAASAEREGGEDRSRRSPIGGAPHRGQDGKSDRLHCGHRGHRAGDRRYVTELAEGDPEVAQ